MHSDILFSDSSEIFITFFSVDSFLLNAKAGDSKEMKTSPHQKKRKIRTS